MGDGTPHPRRDACQGKTLGVVGVGHIGSEVARLGAAFGCRVLANDIRPLDNPIAGVSMVDLNRGSAS